VKSKLVVAQVENLVGYYRFSRSYEKCGLGINPISVNFAQLKNIGSDSAKDVKCVIIGSSTTGRNSSNDNIFEET
jgi:hypothetical protein